MMLTVSLAPLILPRMFPSVAMLLSLVVGQVPISGAEPEAAPTPVAAPEALTDPATLGVPTPLEDPGGKALAPFYESLKATERGEKTTRVVFFGASHVAADSFTRDIRHRLQGRFGDAGPGFVVPAAPWRDSNQRDVNISYSEGWSSFWVSQRHNRDDGLYGLAGCSFASRDRRQSCTIETAQKSLFGRMVSRFEIFYWGQPRGGDLNIKVDGRRKRRLKTRSRKAGPKYREIKVTDGGHSLELKPRGNGRVTLFGVVLERDAPGVVMDTLGINGARASNQLKWDARVMQAHLERRRPDLVVLAYGTNATGHEDPMERYEKEVDLVVNRLRSFAPEASCIFIGPSDRPVQVEVIPEAQAKPGEVVSPVLHFLPRPRQDAVIEAQRRVAHRYGCAYWDWAKAMGGSLSMLRWVHTDPTHAAPDYVHLRRPGYARIAALFWDALMGPFDKAAAEAVSP